MEKITISYTLTREDIDEYVAFLFGSVKNLSGYRRLVILGLMFAFFLGFALNNDIAAWAREWGLGGFYFIAYFLLLIPGLLVAYIVLKIQFNRFSKTTFESSKQLSAPTTLDVDFERFHIMSVYADSNLTWAIFVKVAETKSLFLVFVSKSSAYVIPKRAFANTLDRDSFRDLVFERVGAEIAKDKLPDHLITK